MEFILSEYKGNSDAEILEDETFCSRGLCGHPSCWASHIRETRGFKKYISMPQTPNMTPKAREEEENSSLPTMKVLNMLDDYGESPKDLFPSTHGGRALHQRPDFTNIPDKPQLPCPSPSRSMAAIDYKDYNEVTYMPMPISQVEVQEVFDLEELSQNWDSTFITQPMYVWIPGAKKKKKKNTVVATQKSDQEKHSQGADVISLKNVTDDFLPKQPQSSPIPPYPKFQEYRSPLPTGGQPYNNVGSVPKDRLRYQMVMDELKDLPRPFMIEALEKSRSLKEKEEILHVMERYLHTMKKSDWEMSLITSQVLKQRGLSRASKLPSQPVSRAAAVNTPQVYKLDFPDEQEEQQDDETISILPTARYKPLPSIGSAKKTVKKKKKPVRVHVAASTEESVKPFRYKKNPQLGFCLEYCPSNHHIRGPHRNHLCKHFTLYQFLNDHQLAQPKPAVAKDYCDIFCSQLNWPEGHKKVYNSKNIRVKSIGTNTEDIIERFKKISSSRSTIWFPDLQRIPAIGTKPHHFLPPFDSVPSPSSSLSLAPCPTRSISTIASRPHSNLTARSADSALRMNPEADDLDVMYDQKSLALDANNNNKQQLSYKEQEERLQEKHSEVSKESPPKAPAPTPYSPKTPHRDSTRQMAAQTSKNSEKGLGVINEAAATGESNKNLAADIERANQSITKKADKRIVSAQMPKVEYIHVTRKSSSADGTMKPFHRNDEVPEQTRAAAASRTEILSTTSQWPTVDEEEILKQQTAEAEEEEKKNSTPPKSSEKASKNEEAEELTSTNITHVDSTKEQTVAHESTRYESRSPVPPPPSPEGTQRESRLQDIVEVPTGDFKEDTSVLNNGLNVDGHEVTRDSTMQTDKQESDQNEEEATPKNDGQHSQEENESEKGAAESCENELTDNERLKAVYLSLHPEEGDPYSRMPEVDGMDLERDITLSAQPPSALDTPDLRTPTPIRPTKTQNSERSKELPTLTEMMKHDDEGGLAG